MDKATLVERDIEAGRKLIQALDDQNFRVEAALWLYRSESDQWRLLIASPLADQQGWKWAYDLIQSVIKSEQLNLSLGDISVVNPKDSFIQLLKHGIHVRASSGARFSHNVIGNVFIEDMYVYRLT